MMAACNRSGSKFGFSNIMSYRYSLSKVKTHCEVGMHREQLHDHDPMRCWGGRGRRFITIMFDYDDVDSIRSKQSWHNVLHINEEASHNFLMRYSPMAGTS